MRDDLTIDPEESLLLAGDMMKLIAVAMRQMVEVEDLYGDGSPQFRIAEKTYEDALDMATEYDEATQDLIDQMLYTYHECWLHGYHPSMPVVVVES